MFFMLGGLNLLSSLLQKQLFLSLQYVLSLHLHHLITIGI